MVVHAGADTWLRRRILPLLAMDPLIVLALLSHAHTHDLIRYFPQRPDLRRPGRRAAVPAAQRLHLPAPVGRDGVLVVRLVRISPGYRALSVVLVRLQPGARSEVFMTIRNLLITLDPWE